jgi:carbon monoxide dehydrogenase subunit G
MNRWGRRLAIAGAVLIAAVAVLFTIGYFRSPEITANASIEIARPAPQVWEFLSTPENLPKWSTEVTSVVKTSPTRYKVEGSSGAAEMEMVTMEPPRRYVSRMASPAMGFAGEWDIQVEPVTPASSRVTSKARITIDNLLFRTLSIVMDGNAAELDTLVQLKKYLESQS